MYLHEVRLARVIVAFEPRFFFCGVNIMFIFAFELRISL